MPVYPRSLGEIKDSGKIAQVLCYAFTDVLAHYIQQQYSFHLN